MFASFDVPILFKNAPSDFSTLTGFGIMHGHARGLELCPFQRYLKARPLTRSLDYSVARSLGRSITCSIAQSLDRWVARTLARSLALSLYRSIALSTARSLDRSLARLIAQSLDRSIDSSLACSLARLLVRPCLSNSFPIQVFGVGLCFIFSSVGWFGSHLSPVCVSNPVRVSNLCISVVQSGFWHILVT